MRSFEEELKASKLREQTADILFRSQLEAVLSETNKIARISEVAVSLICLAVFSLGVTNTYTVVFASYRLWFIISGIIGAFGAYRMIFALLERPTRGLATLQNHVNKIVFMRKLNRRFLNEKFDTKVAVFEKGRVRFRSRQTE